VIKDDFSGLPHLIPADALTFEPTYLRVSIRIILSWLMHLWIRTLDFRVPTTQACDQGSHFN